VDAFETFNETLSEAGCRVSRLSREVFRLEQAHWAFANRFSQEWEAAKLYQRAANWFLLSAGVWG
jgi:hypothetical protein